MTLTAPAPSPAAPTTRPRPLPPAVRELSARLGTDLVSGSGLDARAANAALLELARRDVAAACLGWRQVSNLARLAGRPGLAPVAAAIVAGELVATVLGAKARGEIVPGGVRIRGRSLMTTGVAHASWLVVEAGLDDGTSTVAVLPATAVTNVRRPTLIGLADADNALIDLDGLAPWDAVMATPAAEVVSAPYDAGLTMGAVAVGAAEAVLELLIDPPQDARPGIGALRAEVAAAHALVSVTPDHAPRASWWSKAAKVAATTAAESAASTVRRLLGASTYSSGHPLNALEADIRGLAGQAPAHDGAVRAVALPHP